MNPVPGMALVLAFLALLLAGLQRARTRWGLAPEWARKGAHLGLGGAALAFPWLFRQAWPVECLCALALLALAAVRWWGPARALGGATLHDVSRHSWGELYFPLAIGILFPLTQGRPLRYAIPILLLTLADATAALVGARYGLSSYTTKEGRKSWEGSLSFFVVGFFAVHVPLLLWGDLGRAETLFLSLTLALVVMLVEAIAWDGLDNLFIPLGSHLLLGVYLTLGARALLTRFLVTLGLVGFTRAWHRRTTLDDAGLLGSALAGYGFYALGGWPWMLPPLALFALSAWSNRGIRAVHRYNIHAVLATAGPAVLWLILKRVGLNERHYIPFATCYAAHLAIGALTHWAFTQPRKPIPLLALRSIAWGVAWVGALVAVWAAARDLGSRTLVLGLGASAIGTALGVALFALWQPGVRHCPADGRRWSRQAACGILASAGAYALMRPWL